MPETAWQDAEVYFNLDEQTMCATVRMPVTPAEQAALLTFLGNKINSGSYPALTQLTFVSVTDGND